MNSGIRRLVVWADFTPESARAAQWAARHAEARALSLHLLHTADAPALAAVDGTRPIGRFPQEPRPADAVRLALDADRLHTDHRGLRVTTQVAENAYGRPAPEHLEPGDVLVTGPFGYRELSAGAGAGQGTAPQEALRFPIVVVPCDTPHPQPRRRVLLLTGLHLARDLAAFAFTAAAELGVALEVVRVVPQSPAFGEDYWIDTARLPYRAESRLKADLDAAHHQHPQVVWSTATLRVRPWRTLRGMAEGAQLAVLPAGHRSTTAALGVLLDSGSCPVALVPSD